MEYGKQSCFKKAAALTSSLFVVQLFVQRKVVGFQLINLTIIKCCVVLSILVDTLVSHVLESFTVNAGFSDGLFVMTTATDHKNNLNRSTIKKNYSRTLRVESIANSAGGTAAVAMVAQPSTGFLNGRFLPGGSPTEDTEDCLGRITVGLTRSKSLTITVSPIDMMGLIGMAQVLATLAYGIKGLRRGVTTWDWPYFLDDPQQKNDSQMERWSLNQTPSWAVPPLAIANRHFDSRSQQFKNIRYRLILVKCSDIEWLRRNQRGMRELTAVAEDGQNNWVPLQNLPSPEIILFGYAADRSSRPTCVCLPSGLYNARSGRVMERAGTYREVTPLPGILFFDAWRVEPIMNIPSNLPSAQDAPEEDALPSSPASPRLDQAKAREEEARDILAGAVKNRAEDGPSTRKAAIRAYKYLYAIVNSQTTWPSDPASIRCRKDACDAQQRHHNLLGTGHNNRNSPP